MTLKIIMSKTIMPVLISIALGKKIPNIQGMGKSGETTFLGE